MSTSFACVTVQLAFHALPPTCTASSTAGVEGYESADELTAFVERSIHPQAVGWWILAALAALVGLVVIGQAVARQSITESRDYHTMAALGADRRQLVALGMTRNLAVALVGASGAVVLATALSPLAPVGEARIAEPATGLAFDTPVLLLGALATVAVVLALGFWTARRATRVLRPDDRPAASHPSAVAARLATMGVSPARLSVFVTPSSERPPRRQCRWAALLSAW